MERQSLIERVLAGAIIDCDPCDIVEIDRRMDAAAAHNWFAKSALEMACWDIRGKAQGKPVYELLGGACRPLAVRSRYSMGAYEPEKAAARAQGTRSARLHHDQSKGRPRPDGRHRARAGCSRGDRPADRIDGGCQLRLETPTTAIRCINELADCNLALDEQPTPDGDYAAIARVRRETTVPVMADDMCFNLVHAQELVRNNACDVISVYPGKNGGIRKAKEIVDFAAGHNVACSIGSNLELDVATAAMAHLVVACPNMQVEKYPGDMLGADYHEIRIARNPIQIEGPMTTITDAPGLGVEVDWELVRKCRCE